MHNYWKSSLSFHRSKRAIDFNYFNYTHYRANQNPLHALSKFAYTILLLQSFPLKLIQSRCSARSQHVFTNNCRNG